MIKALIFDLDGVLVDSDLLHFNAFNNALKENNIEPITNEEHNSIFKGKPTKEKINILRDKYDISFELEFRIQALKQKYTNEVIESSITPDAEKIHMLQVYSNYYKIVVCSNAISSTVSLILKKLKIDKYITKYFSNEDVTRPKPSPEIYRKAFEYLSLEPEECLIIEDSEVGIQAAKKSGANLLEVKNPEYVNYYSICSAIDKCNKINVVIPAAGIGKRFVEAGFYYPKPLIKINNEPMISLVLKNFDHDNLKIFALFQESVIEKYNISKFFNSITIIPVKSLTEGAACTVLLASDYINNNNALVIANSDQYILPHSVISDFLDHMISINADAGALTFNDNDPKWSYIKTDKNDVAITVAEKNPISNNATVGIYYYKKGLEFVKYANQMIDKNIRTNNEFYVCPVFNEYILDNKKVHIFNIDKSNMNGLGTPADYEKFINEA